MPQLSCPYQPELACLISRTYRHNSTHYNIKGKKRKTFKDVDPIIFLFKTDLQAVPVSGFVPIHDATVDTLGEIVKKAHLNETRHKENCIESQTNDIDNPSDSNPITKQRY
jgi:hypothetical protein